MNPDTTIFFQTLSSTDIYLLLFYTLVTGLNISILISTFRNLLKSKKLSHLFFLISHVLILVWMFSLYYGLIFKLNYPIDISSANRIGFAATGISAVFLPLYLFHEFGFLTKKRLYLINIIYSILGIMIGIISLVPNGVVAEYSLIQSRTIYGPFREVFSISILIAYISPILFLPFRIRIANGLQKFQMKLLLPTLFLTILMILVTNLILPTLLESSTTSLLGPMIISIYYFIVFYTSFRYRLINIPTILTQFFNIFLKISFVLCIFFVLNTINNNAFSIAFLIIIGVFSGRIINLIDRITFRFNNSQERSTKLESLINNLSKELDINFLCKLIETNTTGVFPGHECYIAIIDKDSKSFLYLTQSLAKQEKKILRFFQTLESREYKTFTYEDAVNERETLDPIVKFMRKNNIGVIVPLTKKVLMNGILLISGNIEEIFSEKDLLFAEKIANNTSVAVSRALLYRETKNFAQDLEKTVEIRTNELQRSNKHLADAVEELKKLDAAKSEFISIASHQLRTPISIIRGYVTMIKDGDFGALNDEQKDTLDRIQQGAKQLSTIIDDILNASRIEQGRLVITPEIVNINEMCHQIVADLQLKATTKGITVSIKNSQKQKLQIEADKGKIYEVLMNIIDNGINYTQKGNVMVMLEEKDKSITVSVKDSGIGIPKESQSKIFQRFSRLENAKKVRPDGTGIGLYIAKTIVDAHGGKVWFTSKENEGTTFYITFLKHISKTILKRLENKQRKVQLEHSTTPSIS